MQLKEALENIQQYSSVDLPAFQLLLACGFSPLHLKTFLQAHSQRRLRSHRVQTTTGLYGDLLGTISQLGNTPVDACAVVVEWQDLDPRLGFRQLGGWDSKILHDIVTEVELKIDVLSEALTRPPRHVPIALSCPTLPLPPLFHTPACQSSEAEMRLHKAVADFALWASGQPNIKPVSQQHLLKLSPFTQRFDFKAELLTGLSYTVTHAERLAGLIAQILVPLTLKKGLITDLDGTIWRGTVGEVGPHAICWDLASHAQIHGLYQQLLAALAEEGVLIGVASKNDPEIVEEAFRRTDLLLSRQLVFPLEAQWQPKSESVGRILSAWNVGPESVVLVDDNPMEVAEVKASFPEMECVLFPADNYSEAERMLYQLRDWFAKETITDEDQLRRESLRSDVARRSQGPQARVSYEDFMRDAQGEITLDFVSAATSSRTLELINKTNQFNLNGIRYEQAEWHNHVTSGHNFAMSALYRDKYGPLGVIAVIKGHIDRKVVFVDTWVMSCRAFARRIEYQCLRVLFERFGAEEVFFQFAPTPRNEPLQEFFAGFLGEKPKSPFGISQIVFGKNCPNLYHKIEVKA